MNCNPELFSGKNFNSIKYIMDLFMSNKAELELLFNAEGVP